MHTYVADENVTLTLTVKRQLLRDLLCTAVEGGSTYWAQFSDASLDKATGDYLKVRVMELEAHGDRLLNRFVTADELRLGLERLTEAPFETAWKHLTDALSENGDAGTADVVLQMTLFGDIVYG